MKKLLILLASLSLTACNVAAEGEKLIDDTIQSYENVINKYEETSTEIKNAVTKIEETKSAVDSVLK